MYEGNKAQPDGKADGMARQKVWVLGGGTLAAGLAVVAWLAARQTDPAPGPAPLAQGSLIPPVVATGPAVEVAPQVQPAPSFDVVRVARDGAALVAGNATPGAAVTLRVDGAVVAEVAADGAGQFVAMFALGYSDAAQVMTLESAGADGVVLVAEDSVLLTPRAAEVAEAPAAAPSVEAVAAAAPQPEAPAADATPEATAAPAAEAAPAAPPEATAALTADAAPAAEAAPDAPPGATAALSADAAPAAESAPEAPPEATTALTEAPAADAAPEATAALAAEPAAAPLTEAAAEGDSAIPAPAGEGAGQTVAALETQTAATAGQATADTGAQASAAPLAPAADLAAQAAGTETAEPTATPVASVETAAADATRAATPDPAAPITTAEATQTAEAPDPTVSAPTALLLGRDGSVRVLDRGPVVFDAVIVDTISYSDIGEVQIAGRASGRSDPANLRIYLDNRPIAAAQAASGDWTSDLPDVDPGIYTLRVDQVNAEGRVVSRFETPFQREAPEAVAAARAQTTEPSAETAAPSEPAPASAAPPSATLITVQPGHTLWAISRDRYGMGERYVTIFNANRSQIRDPDLIYPGQIFTLPGE